MGRVHYSFAPKYSHAELVNRAVAWLYSGERGCKRAWARPTILTDEQPDAIG